MSAGQRAALHERAERARIEKERKRAEWRYRRQHGLWHPKCHTYILPEEGSLYEDLKKAEERKAKTNKICDLIECATMFVGVLGTGAAILYFCLLSHITEENREPKKDPVAEVSQANTNQTIVVTRQNQTTNMAAQVYRERAQQMK